MVTGNQCQQVKGVIKKDEEKFTTNGTNRTNKRAFFKQKVRGVREVRG
jgi:hypothetical protein